MVQVSVVVPTHGRSDVLRSRAIASALGQTRRDLELIVVVDGADPATIEDLGGIEDPRLRVVSYGERRGAGGARDAGVAASTGRWVAFLDDDDEWAPDKIERQLDAAGGRPAILMTLSRVVTPTGVFVRPTDPYDGSRPLDEWLFDRASWLRGGTSFLQTSSLMMPRAFFDRLRFGDTAQHEEWELVIRGVKQLGYELVTVPEPLVTHYVAERRRSLSKTYTWRRSLDWIEGMGELITPRARSGFCLNVVGQSAANARDASAIPPLLRAAFRKGRPSARQLFAFVLMWGVPGPVRWWLRRLLQGEPHGPGTRLVHDPRASS